jgi:S1-C subfamily serine protease
MTTQQPSPFDPPKPPAAPRFEPAYPSPAHPQANDETQTAVPVQPAHPVFAAPEPWPTTGDARPAQPYGSPTAQPYGSPSAPQGSWAWDAQPPATPPKSAPVDRRRVVTPGLLMAAVVGTAILTSGGTYLAVSASQPHTLEATNSGSAGMPPTAQAPSAGGGQGSGTAPAPGAGSGRSPVAPAPQQTQAPQQDPAPQITQGSVVDIMKAISPAVVTIQADGITSTDPTTGMTGQGTAVGSGVIFDANGLILTNRHVVSGDPSKLTVTLKDGRSFGASIYGVDTLTDLAIVKVDATGLPTAPMGDSAAIEVGQQAIAIGSPLGEFTDSVTSGIVSALGRSIDTAEESLTNLIQTDTAINPGNSGGPLLDASGRVIGINTAVASQSQGIGFAIPINIARPMLDQASAGQPLARAWLGVRFETIDAALQKDASLPVAKGAWIPTAAAQSGAGAQAPNAQDPNAQGQDPNAQGTDPFNGQDPFGIFGQGQDPNGGTTPFTQGGGSGQSVTPQEVVVAGSPAEKAGLRAGDIITSLNGTTLDATHTLDLMLGQMTPGQTATFGVLRDGQNLTLTVTLGTRPQTA